MDLNTVLMILGGAVFVLPVTYMLGYARHEKQQEGWQHNARLGFEAERKAIFALHSKDINNCHMAILQERNVVRELEISLLKAGESIEVLDREVDKYRKQWKYADAYRKAIVEYLVVNHMWDFRVHSDDPMVMIETITKDAAKDALDPTISKAAKNLHTRGVRKGAKAGREQMRKLMQKCIDNQAATIRQYDVELTKANLRRMRFTEAVTNVMNDKIALPGVRRAFNQAIIQEHDRLRAVAAIKGE